MFDYCLVQLFMCHRKGTSLQYQGHFFIKKISMLATLEPCTCVQPLATHLDVYKEFNFIYLKGVQNYQHYAFFSRNNMWLYFHNNLVYIGSFPRKYMLK